MAFSTIQPYQYVAIRLPSDYCKIEQLLPNSLINLGKYGSFRANNILGRPYHLTFEILERSEVREGQELRVVPAAEIHATALLEGAEVDGNGTPDAEVDGYGLPTDSKSNVNIIDDPTNQKLTMAEIEALKQDEMGSSKDIIAKIMQSHSALDQKTAFSLAKYTLRKHKKYIKRFTVFPLDATMLADYVMTEKDFSRVMELRNETIGLIGCWANVHADGNQPEVSLDIEPYSRYLMVDDTGGLVVAAIAERMGILHQERFEAKNETSTKDVDEGEEPAAEPSSTSRRTRKQHYGSVTMSAKSNFITLVHANQQPNLSLLRYFNFDPNSTDTSHPLHTHLKTLSWLQLCEPENDTTFREPEIITPEDLAKLKSNRRSAYFRKRRRWERTKSVIDETRAGGFNGLIVASFTNPVSILHHLVPLLAGGSQVVVYSPHIEPLVELADIYSTARRTAFISTAEDQRHVPSDDFPLDPTLLLVPTVQTTRVRKWQVLPGRTHPLMTGRGGAEGYVFTSTRVLPVEGKISARGRPPRGKKAKVRDGSVVIDNELSDAESSVKRQKTTEAQEHTIDRILETDAMTLDTEESAEPHS